MARSSSNSKGLRASERERERERVREREREDWWCPGEWGQRRGKRKDGVHKYAGQ
jgi:hypothetical protein